jgi:HK97 family phage major capsid protein
MNLKETRTAKLAEASAIVDGAKAAVRAMTPEEKTQVDELLKAVEALDVQIEAAEQDEARFKKLSTLTPEAQAKGRPEDDPAKVAMAKTLGDHFIKAVGPRLAELKAQSGLTLAAPEFKAAADNQVTTGAAWTPVLTEYDRTIVRGNRTRLVVADLLGSGTISGNAISYFVEGALEGAFTTVAEAGAKPQMHVVDPTAVTDSLKKIAGFIKFTDEMVEDLDFYVSEINNRLLYELAKFEEQQLLNGNGTGSNVLGLLNRSGIQTLAGATTAVHADRVFESMTLVSTGSGLDADGIVIHPTDYQRFRLMKDANSQYYGGGFFQNEYGVGTLVSQPPLWGLRTVVTPAIAAGTVLVGAYASAATLYRKGGVRVESTNSHASDFTSNLITTRAEERVALAVRVPSAFVKLTLTVA